MAFIHGRRCALKHVQLLGESGQVRNYLNGGYAGADDSNTLVVQPVEDWFALVPAGVFVIPTGRMENLALEVIEPRHMWHLRCIDRAHRHDDETSSQSVTTIRGDSPAF